MKHVRDRIVELRRYIAKMEARDELQEVDALLSVALEEVKRKIAEQRLFSGRRLSIDP